MTPQKPQVNSKASNLRPVRKMMKGASETARLFIDINESIKRTQAMHLSRYVE